MAVNYEVRYPTHPDDAKHYDTERLRKEYLVKDFLKNDEIYFVLSHYDRMMVGGAVPVTKPLTLETIEPLKAPYFLERTELGIINIGNTGKVSVDGKEFILNRKDALYVGKGNKEVIFSSLDSANPARFYLNAAPAHKEFPTKLITLKDAEVVELGSSATSNQRRINKLMVNTVVETCQLQMGMTELLSGSVWNTMPAHLHDRRMEVYFYFDVPENQAVCHFMGHPQETRHLWLHNEQAVLSPTWSIHCATATASYVFIWGMAGQNMNYGDMDVIQPTQLR